jgi:serine/threonine protein kinase
MIRPIRVGSPVSVFEAVDGGTPVVVKQLGGGEADPIGIKRFEREIALSVMVNHPRLAQVHGHGSGWIAFERLNPLGAGGRWVTKDGFMQTAPNSQFGAAPHPPVFSPYTGRRPPSSILSPIDDVAEQALSPRQASFSPLAGRRCRQADEGQDQRASIGAADIRRLVAELAEALAYLHARGIVHRDVKPAHVMFRGEQPVLIDLGVAGLIADDPLDGELVGSPAWMAPEQILGAKPAPSADIWSLSAVGASLARGTPLFSGSADAVLEERRQAKGERFRLPEHLGDDPRLLALLEAGLGPAEDRPSAAEMAQELQGTARLAAHL